MKMKMKMILFMSVFLLATAPVWANASLGFSTVTGTGDSWTMTRTGTAGNYTYTMTFGAINANKVNVDGSIPTDSDLLGDYLHLPDMTLVITGDNGTQITGLLTPASGQSLTITDNMGVKGTVMTADVTQGTFITFGSTYMAFSVIKDNLDITQYVSPYSTVIDEFVAIDADPAGELDLSFTGNTSGRDIYAFLKGSGTPTVGGTIDGQINGMYVPVPGAILLGGIGVSLVGWLRRRRTL